MNLQTSMIGRTLGKYRIVSPLGEGAMGSVWLAEHPVLGRTIALKILNLNVLDPATGSESFLREARIASALNHPAIATVHDAGESEGTAWIAYRFIDGESVKKRTDAGPLSIADAIVVARDVAAGLAYAHAHGVLHRDVSANNVMVVGVGHGVLVDFGLARPVGATATMTLSGTPGYMAPEVWRGESRDVRADLYSLGAVLYQMLVGRPPFEGTWNAIVYQSQNERVRPPSELRPEIPATLEQIVLKLLDPDPDDRYGSAGEVEAALAAVDPDRKPSRSDRGWRAWVGWRRETARRIRQSGLTRTGVIALGAVAILVLAALIAWNEDWLTGLLPGPPILAVLPFRNETSEPEGTDYIAEGLAEELASNLAQTDRLRVLPWVTTQRVRLDSLPLPQIAQEFRARKLLTGTMRNTTDGLEISLSLIDGTSGVQSWSRSFEGSADQLPSLEARMLFEAATAALGRLTPEERTRMQLPSGRDGRAYNLYLEGAAQLRSGDPVSLATAEQFFQRAMTLDPTLAEAHLGLGAVYNARYFMNLEGSADDFSLAKQHFREAYRLDPHSALALRGLVSIAWQDGRYEDCLKLGMEAARQRPATLDRQLVTAEAYSLALPGFGLKLSEQCLAKDPSNPAARFWAVISSAFAGQAQKVLDHGAEYVRRFGEYAEVYGWMAQAALKLHQPAKALALARRAAAIEGDSGDPRVLVNLAAIEGAVLGPTAALHSWRRARDVLVERDRSQPGQPRIGLHLTLTLFALGDTLGAAREWAMIAPALASRQYGVVDYALAPVYLLRSGHRAEARHLLELMDNQGMNVSYPAGSLARAWDQQIVGGSEDPLQLEFTAAGRRHASELAARYGKF